jgi:hypothetical protein
MQETKPLLSAEKLRLAPGALVLADKESLPPETKTTGVHCGRDGVLVANLAAERARLGEANVMRFASLV